MPVPSEYIGYRSWNRIRNSGDAITPYILEGLTGIPSRAVGPEVPHILAVGSILFFANKNSHIWGAGILTPESLSPEIEQSTFYALRGRKSWEFLRRRGIQLGDLPLGDPGIFAREVCELVPEERRRTKFRAAFVPHHDSINHPLYQSIRESGEFAFVDILDDSLLPLEQTLQSEIVISQSLHGLIYAESLGKPSLWISDRTDEIWKFKFEDWYSTTAEPQTNPMPLSTDIEALIDAARLCGSTIDKEALANALPVHSATGRSQRFMNFRSCRNYSPAVLFVETLFAGRRYAKTELDAETLDSMRRKIFPSVYRLYSGWAERGYCLIAPADEPIELNQDKISAVARYLDEHTSIDYAYVMGQDTPDSSADELRLISHNAVAGGAVMLRPDSYQLTQNYVTFYV